MVMVAAIVLMKLLCVNGCVGHVCGNGNESGDGNGIDSGIGKNSGSQRSECIGGCISIVSGNDNDNEGEKR